MIDLSQYNNESANNNISSKVFKDIDTNVIQNEKMLLDYLKKYDANEWVVHQIIKKLNDKKECIDYMKFTIANKHIKLNDSDLEVLYNNIVNGTIPEEKPEVKNELNLNEIISKLATKYNTSFDKVKADVDVILESNPDLNEEDDFSEILDLAIQNKYAKSTYLGVKITYPFIVKNNTLYVEKLKGSGDSAEYVQVMVSKRAFIVKSVGEIKDKGDFESIRYVVLAWIDIDGNEKTMIVQENYILDSVLQRDNLKQLSIVGTRRSEFIEYYCKLLENNDIDILEITKVGGWKDNFTRYVTADNTYGSTKEYMLFENSSMENVHKNGTFDNWIEGTYELLNDEVFAFIAYTGVCALIQRPLGIPNFSVINSNDSSTGKTTGGKERSSMFGNPFHMMITSNASRLGIPNTIGLYNDVPTHIDEIKKEDIPLVRNLVYNISTGTQRIVATKFGGVKNNKHDTFTTNIIVTTEEAIFDASVKMGQNARIITIIKTPKSNPEGIKKFERMVCNKNGNCNNYGHAVEPLVAKISNMIQDGSLYHRFSEIEKELRTFNESKSNMVNRLIEYYAAIALAGEIFNEAIVNHPENRGRIQALNPIEITKGMMQDYMEQEPDKSEGTRAIEIIVDWYNGNKFKFNEPEKIQYSVDGCICERDQIAEFYGYDEGDTIDIFKYKAKEVLTKAGFNPETILGKWNDEGYTECKKGRNDKYKKLKKEHYEMLQNDLRLQELIGKGTSTQAVSIKKSMVKHLLIDNEKTAKSKEIIPSQYTEEEWNIMKNKESPKIHIDDFIDSDDNTASA